MIENILIEHDPHLLSHFNKCGLTAKQHSWVLLVVAFSETLGSLNWLTLWDHILSNEPAYILMVTAAYNIVNRAVLLNLKTVDEFDYFYHNQNPIDIKKLVNKSYYLLNNTTERNHPRQYLESFKPLGKNCYPKFLPRSKIVMDQEN